MVRHATGHFTIDMFVKNIVTAFTTIFLLGHSSINAQTVDPVDLTDSVDSLIATQFKPEEPGVSVLIANKNDIIYKKAFGSANVELNVAMQGMLF